METDPDNRLLWRMNPSRMEAEVVRDSVLHLAVESPDELVAAVEAHRAWLQVDGLHERRVHRAAREIETLPDSSGSRTMSSTCLWNSGASSRNSTE